MPTVTVVMPLYNAERYVEQAIASVLAQTYVDFELIVVDDGSTDESVQRVRRFRDPRIRLVIQANRGLAGARNTGIRHARGRYIALLDADDAWQPDKLAWHVDHLNSRPKVGVSYSQSAFMDDDGRPLGLLQVPKLTDIQPVDVLCRNPVGNGSAPVLRKAALDSIRYINEHRQEPRDCWFDEELRQSEDIECWLRIASQTTWEFEGIGLPLTWCRVSLDGLSANLEKQYQSWLLVRDKARVYAPSLIQRYGSLAEAYQLRYLARRAVRSQDAAALRLMGLALRRDWRIALAEPFRTLSTLGCAALLVWLPAKLYHGLEQRAMDLNGLWHKLRAYVPV
jgi:glycosyltransferase involved in cell wall biosynthesis